MSSYQSNVREKRKIRSSSTMATSEKNLPKFTRYNTRNSTLQSEPMVVSNAESNNEPCVERTIFVVHLIDSEENILTIQNTHCSTRDWIAYDVQYKPIISDSFDFEAYGQELLGRISQIPLHCIAVLIVNNSYDNETIKKIFQFIPVQLYSAITIYNFNPSEDIDQIIPSSIKLRNIIYDNPNPYTIERESETILSVWTKYGLERSSRFSDFNSSYIDCVWWFKYYLSNAFNCAKGRYKQVSGTCYLNSVINGFILSEYSRKAVLSALRNSDPKTQALAKEPVEINPGTCYKPEYFFKLFYNAVCRPKNFSDLKFNKRATRQFDKPNLIVKYASKFYGDSESGGSPADVVSNLLKVIYSHDTVTTINPFYYDANVRVFRAETEFPQIRPVNFNSTLYDPDFCIIHVSYDGHMLSEIARYKQDADTHAIVGYKCNGVCKVYDSNNFFYDFDWENIDEKNVSELLNILNTIFQNKWKWNQVEILAMVFIRNESKVEFNEMNQEHSCSF